MAWPLDHSQDYKANDWPEAVTLASSPAFTTTQSVAKAFRGPLTNREYKSTEGAYVRMEAVFDVPMTLLDSYVPKPGDKLTDSASTVYRIYTADKDQTTAYYRLIVFNPTIAFSLRDSINIKETTETKDDGGFRIANFTTVSGGSDLSCRVQPEESDIQTVADRINTNKRFTIYLLDNFTFDLLPSKMVVEMPAAYGNAIADIERYADAKRVDELATLSVVLRA